MSDFAKLKMPHHSETLTLLHCAYFAFLSHREVLRPCAREPKKKVCATRYAIVYGGMT
jgi:hypothetical protein